MHTHNIQNNIVVLLEETLSYSFCCLKLLKTDEIQHIICPSLASHYIYWIGTLIFAIFKLHRIGPYSFYVQYNNILCIFTKNSVYLSWCGELG